MPFSLSPPYARLHNASVNMHRVGEWLNGVNGAIGYRLLLTMGCSCDQWKRTGVMCNNVGCRSVSCVDLRIGPFQVLFSQDNS